MRVIKEFRDPRMKISIFSFNEKWIVKTEAGLCEQTFKFPQDEWTLEQVSARCEDETFKQKVTERFQQMHTDLNTP